MMERHPTPARIHDWADGLLEPGEAARLEDHLEACPACAAEAAALRDLRGVLGSLPTTLDPGEDLRPGIRELRHARANAPGQGARSARTLRDLPGAALAAAAVVVLALGTAAILVLRGAGPGGPAGGSPVAEAASRPGVDDPAAAVVLALDREYERAGEELKARMERGTAALGARASRLLAAEIAAVEAALETTRAALREDPGSPVLRELVLVAHRQRMDVLRRAVALATEMEAA